MDFRFVASFIFADIYLSVHKYEFSSDGAII